ncbi:hypothetical protein AWN76_008195 [Rhodothermaceae bacterium RA]|nr:hypothetical protein AWN76_008195 [Rhodothermaceae bacterium RA]
MPARSTTDPRSRRSPVARSATPPPQSQTVRRRAVRWFSTLALSVLGLCVLVVSGCDSAGSPGDDEPEYEVVGQAVVTLNPEADRRPISPYIYGSNQDRAGTVWTVRRLGGNRLTGYNWENNFSNAGSDYQHYSDRFLLFNAGIPDGEAGEPARVVTFFHDQSLQMGAASIVTLQMAGFVARDDFGAVSAGQTAPSPRWVPAYPRKDAPFTLTPDPGDDAVYMDELVHFLVQRYGAATTPNGIRWYSLDNEPALWAHTHPRIHPDPVGAEELLHRTIDLASAVKDVDPNSEVLGPALYGFAAYLSLQDAPDWNQAGAGYRWFIDYYLDRLRQAEQATGRRLVDVLDVHWYPEARGDHRITDPDAMTPADVAARLQAPRSLWDPTYTETSWIADCCSAFLPILPTLQASIEAHYPGTKLAISEYNYGGGRSVSGGLAQADVLGAFGRHGVYIATLWGIEAEDAYTAAAFRLYRNYDGNGGAYGDTSVRATTSDPHQTSVYAALEGHDARPLHAILINKNTEGALEMQIRIEGDTAYATGEVWAFDARSPQILRRDDVTGITGNTFTLTLPPLTAAHLILR